MIFSSSHAPTYQFLVIQISIPVKKYKFVHYIYKESSKTFIYMKTVTVGATKR